MISELWNKDSVLISKASVTLHLVDVTLCSETHPIGSDLRQGCQQVGSNLVASKLLPRAELLQQSLTLFQGNACQNHKRIMHIFATKSFMILLLTTRPLKTRSPYMNNGSAIFVTLCRPLESTKSHYAGVLCRNATSIAYIGVQTRPRSGEFQLHEHSITTWHFSALHKLNIASTSNLT